MMDLRQIRKPLTLAVIAALAVGIYASGARDDGGFVLAVFLLYLAFGGDD